MIYNFYIFDRHCACLYYAEWARRKKVRAGRDRGSAFARRALRTSAPGLTHAPHGPCARAGRPQAAMSDDEERKLVYGLLFSIKNVCDKLSDNANGHVRAWRPVKARPVPALTASVCGGGGTETRTRPTGTRSWDTERMRTSCTITRHHLASSLSSPRTPRPPACARRCSGSTASFMSNTLPRTRSRGWTPPSTTKVSSRTWTATSAASRTFNEAACLGCRRVYIGH